MERNYTIEKIIKLVITKTGCDEFEVQADTDIFGELGCVGDDFHELISEFAEKFEVDISTYLWYFHADEEGQNFGALFFKPPYCRVKRIPVTPSVLLQAANSGKWMIVYPEHKLPKYRYDIFFTYLILILFFSFMIYLVLRKMVE